MHERDVLFRKHLFDVRRHLHAHGTCANDNNLRAAFYPRCVLA
jgi:hypothetical protein